MIFELVVGGFNKHIPLDLDTYETDDFTWTNVRGLTSDIFEDIMETIDTLPSNISVVWTFLFPFNGVPLMSGK